MAFYKMRNVVKGYSNNAEALEKAKITLGEWLGLNEKARDMKLKFAKGLK